MERRDRASHAEEPASVALPLRAMAGGGGTGCAALEGHGDVWDVLRSATFLFLVWLAGRVVGLGGLPPLVRASAKQLLLPHLSCT